MLAGIFSDVVVTEVFANMIVTVDEVMTHADSFLWSSETEKADTAAVCSCHRVSSQ